MLMLGSKVVPQLAASRTALLPAGRQLWDMPETARWKLFSVLHDRIDINFWPGC